MFRRILWNICGWLYTHVAKPVLFRFPPDVTHNSMLGFSIIVGNIPPLRWFVSLIFRRPEDPLLSQDYHGVHFESPVGLAAGFDKNGEIQPTMRALGFGFGEIGSVSYKPCPGNPKPWFYRLPKTKSAVVNAGLNNQGSKIILERIHKLSSGSTKNYPMILSVTKANTCEVVSVQQGIDDYVGTLKRARSEPKIKMFEINISCPNTYGGEPFTTPDNLEKLLVAIDDLGMECPVYLKMPLNLSWTEFKALLDIIVKHDVAGVTIANLQKDRSKIDLKDPLPDDIMGSFSGKPAWGPSNELIKRTYAAYGKKLTIIGVGGIFSAEDAYIKIRLGASLVELITGVIFNGPQLAAQINDGLISLLQQDGFTHISEAIGVDAKK